MGNKRGENIQIVSDEEVTFINIKGIPFQRVIIGMLISTRTNKRTIAEDFVDAMSDKDNSEHRPAYEAGKSFLTSHADRFKIKPK